MKHLTYLTTIIICLGCSDPNDYSKIYLPESLLSPKGQPLNMEIKDFTVLHFVNFGCSDCYMELESWENLLDSLDIENAFIIASGAERTYVDYIANEQLRFKYPVVYDETYSFYERNNLDSDKSKYTFLVNKDSSILLNSNPFSSVKAMEEFLKVIH